MSTFDSFLKYIDRGDVNSCDFTKVNLIIDGQNHELDLSGIIPEKAANQLVCFKVITVNTLIAARIFFNENGYVNLNNSETLGIGIAGAPIQSAMEVKMDINRKIQYNIQNVGFWLRIEITVRGWFEKWGGGMLG